MKGFISITSFCHVRRQGKQHINGSFEMLGVVDVLCSWHYWRLTCGFPRVSLSLHHYSCMFMLHKPTFTLHLERFYSWKILDYMQMTYLCRMATSSSDLTQSNLNTWNLDLSTFFSIPRCQAEAWCVWIIMWWGMVLFVANSSSWSPLFSFPILYWVHEGDNWAKSKDMIW